MRKLHEEAGLKEVVVLKTGNWLEIYGVQEAGPVPVYSLIGPGPIIRHPIGQQTASS